MVSRITVNHKWNKMEKNHSSAYRIKMLKSQRET